jgi:cysteine-rich repeat protein
MRRRSARRVLAAGALLSIGLATACSSSSPGARLCTPDAWVFCRCADFSEGTKQCASDGMSFGACGPCDAPDTAPPDDTLPPDDTGVIDDTALADDTAIDGAAETASDPSTACPGKVLAVDGTKDTEVTDTTSTSGSSQVGGGACAVGVGKERVYEIIPTASGKLTVQMLGDTGMDPTLYARETDCATGKQLACAETTGAAGSETLNINVLTGKHYWIFADSKAGTQGDFFLTFHLAPGPFCGDGKVDSGEGCDDGNKVALDGCGNNCVPDGDPVSADVCPGQEAHVWPGVTMTIDGSTASYAGTYASTGCTGSGPERVYAVTSHVTGTMTAKITASWGTGSPLLYVRGAPCASGAEIACVNKNSTTPDTLTWPVTSGTTYSLFIDGFNGGKGTFQLSLSAK